MIAIIVGEMSEHIQVSKTMRAVKPSIDSDHDVP